MKIDSSGQASTGAKSIFCDLPPSMTLENTDDSDNPQYPIGAAARINRGPLAGLKGMVVAWNAQERVVLDMTSTWLGVRIEIDPSFVEVIG